MGKDPTAGQKTWMIQTLAELTRVIQREFDGEELEFLRYLFANHPSIKQLMHQAQHYHANRSKEEHEAHMK